MFCRTLYCWFAGCNGAGVCTNTAQDAITIMSGTAEKATSNGGEEEMSFGGGRRKRNAVDLYFDTPPGNVICLYLDGSLLCKLYSSNKF